MIFWDQDRPVAGLAQLLPYWYRCPAGPTPPLPFDQISKAFCQYECGRPHFNDLDLASGDEKV